MSTISFLVPFFFLPVYVSEIQVFNPMLFLHFPRF